MENLLSPRNPKASKDEGQSPLLGFGLRRSHYDDVLQTRPALPFFELISDNYLSAGGVDRDALMEVRKDYPIFFHGVGLSLGSTDPLNEAYLKQLRALTDQCEPAFVSDHISWGSVGGRHFHDLLPLPFTKETLQRLVERITQAQEILGRSLVLENVSSYVRFKEDEFTEWDFLKELIHRSGCQLLLDVNNVFVNSVNFSFDPKLYLEAIPKNSVAQIHIAGAKKVDDFYLDDHGSAPSDIAIELLALALSKFGRATPVVLEWDSNIPSFSELLAERERILSCLSA